MRGKKTFNTPQGAPNHAESVDLSSKGISKRKFLADSKAILVTGEVTACFTRKGRHTSVN